MPSKPWGKPLRVILSAGKIAEIECAHDPIADMPGNEPGADKGYNANALGLSRLAVRKRSLRLAPTVLHPGKHERSAYRARNPVERFFKRVKHSRRMAMRYGKLAGSHMAFAQIVRAVIPCQCMSTCARNLADNF